MTLPRPEITRICFETGGGLTESLLLTAVVRDLHRTYPGYFEISPPHNHPCLWEGNPFVANVTHPNLTIEIDELDYSRTTNHQILNIYEKVNRALGLDLAPSEFKADIRLSTEDRNARLIANVALDGPPYWVIYTGQFSDRSTLRWEKKAYQSVVDTLRSEHRFIQVEMTDSPSTNNRLVHVDTIQGKLSLRHLIQLLYNAIGVITPAGFLSHLAAAVPTPSSMRTRHCISLAGGIYSPRQFYYPGHLVAHVTGALPCCAESACLRKERVHLNEERRLTNDKDTCTNVSENNGLTNCFNLIPPRQIARAVCRYSLQALKHERIQDNVAEPAPLFLITESHPEQTRVFLTALFECENLESRDIIALVNKHDEGNRQLFSKSKISVVLTDLGSSTTNAPETLDLWLRAWEEGFKSSRFVICASTRYAIARDGLTFLDSCREVYRDSDSILCISLSSIENAKPEDRYSVTQRGVTLPTVWGLWRKKWSFVKSLNLENRILGAQYLAAETRRFNFYEIAPKLSRTIPIFGRHPIQPMRTLRWAGELWVPSATYSHPQYRRITAFMIVEHTVPPDLAHRAAECFANQSYTQRELIIVNQGGRNLSLPSDCKAKVIKVPTLNARDLAIAQSEVLESMTTDLIVFWDPLMWHHPKRIEKQASLQSGNGLVALGNYTSIANQSAKIKSNKSGFASTMLIPKKGILSLSATALSEPRATYYSFSERTTIDDAPWLIVDDHPRDTPHSHKPLDPTHESPRNAPRPLSDFEAHRVAVHLDYTCNTQSRSGRSTGNFHNTNSSTNPIEPQRKTRRTVDAGRNRDLAVVILYTNPNNDPKIHQNYQELAAFMLSQDCFVLTVELSYRRSQRMLPNSANFLHAYANDPFCHRETMVNMAIQKIPPSYTKVVWTDCNLRFHNPDWRRTMVSALGRFQVVQAFDQKKVFNRSGSVIDIGLGLAFGTTSAGNPPASIDDFEAGLAWGAQREFLANFGTFELSPIDDADTVMGCALYGSFENEALSHYNSAVLRSIRNWGQPVWSEIQGRVGFVPGHVDHLWHPHLGRIDRKERRKLLCQFDPVRDFTRDPSGLWAWQQHRSPELVALRKQVSTLYPTVEALPCCNQEHRAP